MHPQDSSALGAEWQILLDPEIQDFIRKNPKLNVPEWVLRPGKLPSHWPIRAIAEQIKAYQKAQKKLPSWAKHPGILYESLAMEQCSSEITALRKTRDWHGQVCVDLCGGLGVDTYHWASRFREVHYIEENTHLYEAVSHNMKVLGCSNVHMHPKSAETFLEHAPSADLIYIDPSRRSARKSRVFQLSDCRPRVDLLMEQLELLGKKILLKLSPFLDIQQACLALEAATQRYSVEKIQIIAYQNEVKELLFCLGPSQKEPDIPMEAINLTNKHEWTFHFTRAQEIQAQPQYSLPAYYLLEPFAPIRKAGAFQFFAQSYDLGKLHPNSHLYTLPDAPGVRDKLKEIPARIFKIEAQIPYQKKSLAAHLPQKQAHIQTRNFPDSVPQIRKKMGIREGGLQYIFATTLLDGQLCLLLCRKI